MFMEMRLSDFRIELGNTINEQLGYLMTQFEDGTTAIEELDGHIAALFDKWLKRAFIAGHGLGVQAALKDHNIPSDFSPEADAVYAERKFLDWKGSTPSYHKIQGV